MRKLFAHIEKSMLVNGSALQLNQQPVIDLIMYVWRWCCTIFKGVQSGQFHVFSTPKLPSSIYLCQTQEQLS